MKKQTIVFAVLAILAIAATAIAQEPILPGQPAPGWVSVATLLAAATVLGKIFADAARIMPWVRNNLAPKIAWLACLVANVGLVADAFIRSAGLEAAFAQDPSGVQAAGIFSSLAPALKWLGSSAIAIGQAALLRWIHEHGNKAVFPELLQLKKSVTP